MVTLNKNMQDEVIKLKIRDGNAPEEISWQVEERQTNLKRGEWLWALAIVGFAIVVFSILFKNYLLIVIVALAAFIVYARKVKRPETHDFRLDNRGIAIDEKLYSYENFESFWIFPGNEIALRRKHHLMPLLIVPFHGREETEIRKIIENHLPESEEEESFLDLLQKKFF